MPKVLSPTEIESFRADLCDAAEALFAKHGPDGVTMRELADAVGVSAMTPYRYFESKDALLAAVRARAFTRFADEIAAFDAAAARKYGAVDARAMPRAFFRARTDAYVDFALKNPAAYRLMFDVNQPSAKTYPSFAAAIARTRALMAPRDANGSRAPAASATAHAMWAAAHGVIMLSLSGVLGGPVPVRDLVRRATEAIAEQAGILR